MEIGAAIGMVMMAGLLGGRRIALYVALLILGLSWMNGARADEWEIGPLLHIAHNSAFTTGKPWNDDPELTVDEITFGACVWKTDNTLEFCLSQGWKCFDCTPFEGKAEEATIIEFNWKPKFFRRRF